MNDFIKVTTSVPEYAATMTKYGNARHKTHAEVVTRAAQQANFFCVKSEAAGGMPRAKLGMFPLNATADPQKGGKTFKNRFYYAYASSIGIKKGSGGEIVMRPAAYRLYTKRRSSKGAMTAGALVSARKLGLKSKGAKSIQPIPGRSASKSEGTKAKGQLKATSVNAVKGSYEVGKDVMDRAIRYVIRDMDDFANKLLQETNDEFMR